MEKTQLLLITNNNDFANCIQHGAGLAYEITTIKNVHAGFSLAQSCLPDVILIDYSSLGLESLKNLQNFRSSHFLNKCFLFLYGDKENKKVLDENFKEYVDGIIYDHICPQEIIAEIERSTQSRGRLSNYWKDSFMGLFNLLKDPVILLENDQIVAMNDAFKKDFFITGREQVRLSDLVVDSNKLKVRETLKKFVKGKHMKATTTTTLLMNDKLREARITFSKLDMNLIGQMIMMINFSGKETPFKNEIGSSSKETESHFACTSPLAEQSFTKREKEIIGLLCKGYKTKEISEALCISAKTIEKHRANIIKRTHSGTILESIIYALNHNMIDI